MVKRIVALDFDGVICDSARELSFSAWQVAIDLWSKTLTDNPSCANYQVFDSSQKGVQEFMADFLKLRPFLEYGYHAIMLAFLYLSDIEKFKQLQNCTIISTDIIESTFTREYGDNEISIKELSANNWELLSLALGRQRDVLLREALEKWFILNPLYPEALSFLQSDHSSADLLLVIITTKQQRFAKKILEKNNIQWEEENIYGLESGNKLTILRMLTHHHPNATIHFVEDRIETLIKVSNDPLLAKVRLYVADWGYVNPKLKTSLSIHHPEIMILKQLVLD
jgi:phosphoglycolate phosphatase-like HAD superfamily hydrolase